jgi:photosystem II stability/assembly factor-like uncharacterized protein
LNRHYVLRSAVTALFCVLFCLPLHAANWIPFGPDGGDARAFAADPQDSSHLYLGTATGWLYESHDQGGKWTRLASVGKRDDLALDSIVVDHANPKHIVIGAWVLGSADGGLYISNDGGTTWRSDADMKGQSIRALTPAPSNPQVLVAGTLKGVYRSNDGGEHWTLISPEGSQELHEVESIAIDPVDPQIIYAGTWHLPWKTTDGGAHWTNMKQGLIDDSDVFSIIVDPKDAKTIYASACSGIYKSETAGDMFKKVQGIPSAARRTRVLMQDPHNLNIVFAGTTEGLYRSTDAGANWQRMTAPEVIVNDVYVDPKNTNRVLLATDRGGVLASNDGGSSFSPSNDGFSDRQVTAYVSDAQHPETIYVGVVNDKTFGGVFVSNNGGLNWVQKSAGLDGHDVFSLGQAADGTVLAGTGHGIFRLQGEMWSRVEDVSAPVEAPPASPAKRKRGSAKKGVPAQKIRTATVRKTQPSGEHLAAASINEISRAGDTLYAATSEGLLRGDAAGNSWKLIDGPRRQAWNFVATAKSTVVVGDLHSAMISVDAGQKWETIQLPPALTQLVAVAVDDSGAIWVGSGEGIFVSDDHGATWQTLKNLYVQDVNSLYFDQASQRLLITSNNKNTFVYALQLPDRTVRYWATGWHLRMVRPVGDHLVGATLYDGIVVQPRMVDSAQVESH